MFARCADVCDLAGVVPSLFRWPCWVCEGDKSFCGSGDASFDEDVFVFDFAIVFESAFDVDVLGFITYFHDEVVELCSLVVPVLSCLWDAVHDVLVSHPGSEASRSSSSFLGFVSFEADPESFYGSLVSFSFCDRCDVCVVAFAEHFTDGDGLVDVFFDEAEFVFVAPAESEFEQFWFLFEFCFAWLCVYLYADVFDAAWVDVFEVFRCCHVVFGLWGVAPEFRVRFERELFVCDEVFVVVYVGSEACYAERWAFEYRDRDLASHVFVFGLFVEPFCEYVGHPYFVCCYADRACFVSRGLGANTCGLPCGSFPGPYAHTSESWSLFLWHNVLICMSWLLDVVTFGV